MAKDRLVIVDVERLSLPAIARGYPSDEIRFRVFITDDHGSAKDKVVAWLNGFGVKIAESELRDAEIGFFDLEEDEVPVIEIMLGDGKNPTPIQAIFEKILARFAEEVFEMGKMDLQERIADL